MTGSVHAKNKKKGLHCIVYMKVKCTFLVNTKQKQLSPSGLVPSARYIPQHFLSWYKLYPPLFTFALGG